MTEPAAYTFVLQPLSGEPAPPSEALENFVFMANLQAQEATGDPAVSISASDLVAAMSQAPEITICAVPLTRGDAHVWGEIPATSTALDETEFLGFIQALAPREEHAHALICEIVPDVSYQPISEVMDASVPAAWRRLIETTLRLPHRSGRSYLQLWRRRHPNHETGQGSIAALFAEAGFKLSAVEEQWVMRSTRASPDRDVRLVYDFDFPPALLPQVLDLYEQADADSLHGHLQQRPEPWTEQRLVRARTRLHASGATAATALLTQGDEVLALSEVTYDFSTLSDPVHVAEHTVTVVDRAYRRRGLGRRVQLALLGALDGPWHVYTAFDREHEAQKAITQACDATLLCRVEAWDRWTT